MLVLQRLRSAVLLCEYDSPRAQSRLIALMHLCGLDYSPIMPYTYLRPAPSRGAFRDRHDPRGGMRWTRQRRAAVHWPGRGPAVETVPTRAVSKPESCEARTSRWTTTLCGANRGGDAPHSYRLARRPKSGGPDRNPVCCRRCPNPGGVGNRRRRRRTGSDRCRGEHEASRQTIACGTPDDSVRSW